MRRKKWMTISILFLSIISLLLVRGSPVFAEEISGTSSASIEFYGTLPKPPHGGHGSNGSNSNNQGRDRLPQTGESQTDYTVTLIGYGVLLVAGYWYFSKRKEKAK